MEGFEFPAAKKNKKLAEPTLPPVPAPRTAQQLYCIEFLKVKFTSFNCCLSALERRSTGLTSTPVCVARRSTRRPEGQAR